MSIRIPIISDFDSKGVDKAVKEFQSLEGVGAKTGFAMQKAFLPAVAVVGGLAAGLGVAAKAAIEDAAAQDQLAGVLQRSAMATDEQVAANEKFISGLSRATATADDELRPALASLVTATGSLELSQSLLTQAQDIAASTGNDLTTTVDALSKAYNGNMKGLKALDPSMTDAIKSGMSFDEIMKALAVTTGGAATDAANTAAGKFKGLKISLDEAKESIGAALIPILEKLVPVLQTAAYWLEANSRTVLIAAGVIGVLAGAVITYNLAIKAATLANVLFGASFAVTPIGLVTVAIVALSAALVYLEVKFNAVSDSFSRFGSMLRVVLGPLYDVVALLGKLNVFDNIKLPSFTAPTPSSFGGVAAPQFTSGGAAREGGTGSIIPALPTISIPKMPTFSGGGGGGSFGGGGGGVGGNNDLVTIQNTIPALTTFGIAERIAERGDNITINVNGVITEQGAGQAIVNALKRYNQITGPIAVEFA